ncbi:Cytochrome P450 [Popillia japonica]
MFGIEALVLVVFSLLLYILLRKNANYWKWRNVPFEKPWPFIGNVLDVVLLRKNMAILMGDLYSKYSNERYFGVWIFTVPHLVIRCPELLKQILVKDFVHFIDRSVQCNESVDAFSANMMFFSKDKKWKFIRTKTTSMFSSGKLKYIFPQLQLIAKNMISFISKRNNKSIYTADLAQKFSTEIICSVAFGIDAHSFQDNDTLFTKVGKDVFKPNLKNSAVSATYFCKSYLVDILRLKFVDTRIEKFLTTTFMGIIGERQSMPTKRRDLVDLMADFRNKYKLKDHEVSAQAAQFFLAGYETTSSTVTFALYEIASNQDVQDKLREEINNNLNDEEEFSYNAIMSMCYLHKVALETLRKYPVLPFLGRTCTRDYQIPNSNVIIEKGTSVFIPLTGLHWDPKHFPNPQKFDPDRFSEENIRARHPYCYLPFGEGQRACIGERIALISIKLGLAHLVKNFKLELEKGTEVPKFSANWN